MPTERVFRAPAWLVEAERVLRACDRFMFEERVLLRVCEWLFAPAEWVFRGPAWLVEAERLLRACERFALEECVLRAAE